MIVSYILLALILILLSVLVTFFIYVLLPSLKGKNRVEDKDPVFSHSELNFITPEIEKSKLSENKAFVLCSCNKSFNVERSIFNKQHTCFMINSDNGTGTDCKYSCIGLGDCAKVCPQQAIKIINNTAVVTALCIGCGKCVDICPLHIIQLIPKDTQTIKVCSNCKKDPTSCSAIDKEENVVWNERKGFKIWGFCYKMFKKVIES